MCLSYGQQAFIRPSGEALSYGSLAWSLGLPARAGILQVILASHVGKHSKCVGDVNPQIVPNPLMETNIFTLLSPKTRLRMARFGWQNGESVSEGWKICLSGTLAVKTEDPWGRVLLPARAKGQMLPRMW